MSRSITTINEAILNALGEASALFMSQEVEVTKIVMPTQQLVDIANRTEQTIRDLATPTPEVPHE